MSVPANIILRPKPIPAGAYCFIDVALDSPTAEDQIVNIVAPDVLGFPATFTIATGHDFGTVQGVAGTVAQNTEVQVAAACNGQYREDTAILEAGIVDRDKVFGQKARPILKALFDLAKEADW